MLVSARVFNSLAVLGRNDEVKLKVFDDASRLFRFYAARYCMTFRFCPKIMFCAESRPEALWLSKALFVFQLNIETTFYCWCARTLLVLSHCQ